MHRTKGQISVLNAPALPTLPIKLSNARSRSHHHRAGPSGLSAAIAAKQRSLDYVVLEKGVLVNSIYRFPPQMVFFTTPELLEVGGLPFVSPYEKPTRAEALKYYRKVVDVYDLQIAYEETVLSVAA